MNVHPANGREQILDRLDSELNYRVRLPNNPFQRRWKNFGFDEFDWIMSGDFSEFIDQIANKDISLNIRFCVFRTDEHGVSSLDSAFEIQDRAFRENYWNTISAPRNGNAADAIFAVCEAVAIVPSTSSWAIWAERSHGFAVIGTDEDIATWKSIDWIAESATNDPFGRGPVPESFVRQLKSEFQSSL